MEHTKQDQILSEQTGRPVEWETLPADRDPPPTDPLQEQKKLQTRLEDMRQDQANTQSLLENARQEIDKWIEKYRDLEARLLDKDDSHNLLTSKEAVLQKENEALLQNTRALEKERDEAQQDRESHEHRLAVLEQSHLRVLGKMRTALAEAVSLEAACGNVSGDQSDRELERLLSELDADEPDLVAFADRVIGLMTQARRGVAGRVNQVDSLRQELELARQKVESVEASVRQSQEQVRESAQEMEDLRKANNEAESACKALQTALQTREDSETASRYHRNLAEDRNRELIEKLALKENLLGQLRGERDGLEALRIQEHTERERLAVEKEKLSMEVTLLRETIRSLDSKVQTLHEKMEKVRTAYEHNKDALNTLREETQKQDTEVVSVQRASFGLMKFLLSRSQGNEAPMLFKEETSALFKVERILDFTMDFLGRWESRVQEAAEQLGAAQEKISSLQEEADSHQADKVRLRNSLKESEETALRLRRSIEENKRKHAVMDSRIQEIKNSLVQIVSSKED